MYTASIVIPHINTLFYLKGCVNQIRLYKHPQVEQQITLLKQTFQLQQHIITKSQPKTPMATYQAIHLSSQTAQTGKGEQMSHLQRFPVWQVQMSQMSSNMKQI